MEPILLVYKSNTGFTKKYVDWISDAVSCQTITIDQINNVDINAYDIVIYGGGIKAGHIRGLNKFKKRVLNNSKNKIVVFATGGAPFAEDIAANIKRNNFSSDELNKLKFFYFQSGLDYDKMGLSSKIMMGLYKKILELKNSKTVVEDGTANALLNSYDYSSSDYIKPMIDYLNEVCE